MVSASRLPLVSVLGALAGTALVAGGLLALVQPGVLGLARRSPGLGFGLLVLGVGLVFATSRLARFEGPTVFPPRTLVVYRRRLCAACDEAKAILARELAGSDIAIEEVDVDGPGHEAARKAYTDWVPVGLYEGTEVFRLSPDLARLREAVRR
jgi:hypothetical protein